MDDADESSPFTTRHFAAVIDGIHTEFFLSGYEDRYFFVITQLGKFGTMIKAQKDTSMEGTATYSVSTILGMRNDEALEALALQLMQLIGETSNKPLLLSIALKPTQTESRSVSPKVFRAILKLVLDNRIW